MLQPRTYTPLGRIGVADPQPVRLGRSTDHYSIRLDSPADCHRNIRLPFGTDYWHRRCSIRCRASAAFTTVSSQYPRFIIVAPSGLLLLLIVWVVASSLLVLVVLLIVVRLVVIILVIGVGRVGLMAIAIIIMASLRVACHFYGNRDSSWLVVSDQERIVYRVEMRFKSWWSRWKFRVL